MKQAFIVPIMVEIGVGAKKTHYLNLNKYRGWHYQESNHIKKAFKIKVAEVIRDLSPVVGKCKLTYTIYYPTKRLFDIDNVGSIVSKFTHDALVEFEILEDDNYTVINEITYVFGGLDKQNPRCEVILEENQDE